jgi:hypothetical membrane protein
VRNTTIIVLALVTIIFSAVLLAKGTKQTYTCRLFIVCSDIDND